MLTGLLLPAGMEPPTQTTRATRFGQKIARSVQHNLN